MPTPSGIHHLIEAYITSLKQSPIVVGSEALYAGATVLVIRAVALRDRALVEQLRDAVAEVDYSLDVRLHRGRFISSCIVALSDLPDEQPQLRIDAGDTIHQTLTQIFWAGRNRTRGLVDPELVEALSVLGLVQSNEGGDYIVLSEAGLKRLGELPPLHLSRGGLLTHRPAADHIRRTSAGPKFDLEDGRLVRVADAA